MPENDTLLAFGAGGGGGAPMIYSTAIRQRNLPTRRGRQARQFLAEQANVRRARRTGGNRAGEAAARAAMRARGQVPVRPRPRRR